MANLRPDSGVSLYGAPRRKSSRLLDNRKFFSTQGAHPTETPNGYGC
jgi:hypothetical protein